MRTAAAVVLLLMACAGCSSAPTPAPGHVTGSATIGPTTPVCHEGVSCSGPYDGPLALMDAQGTTTIREFESNNGTFAFDAAPGDYSIHQSGTAQWPRCQSPAFSVAAGQETLVQVDCDSGIR